MRMAVPVRLKILGACLLLALVAGCAGRRPETALLQRQTAQRAGARRPVIVIPGLLGSRLKDRETGRLVWGGVKGFIAPGTGYELALSLNPNEPSRLVPDGLVAEVAGVSVYSDILSTLEQAGYAPGFSDPANRAAFFVFDYDWRQSCVANAAALGRKIKDVQAFYGDPSLKVDVVAHSLGGLVARYYLLYGGRDVRDDPVPLPDFSGSRHVVTVVFMGVPILGAASALRSDIEGNRVGLTPMTPEVLSTGPSSYELMPSPSVSVFRGTDGRPVPLNLYDEATWRRMNWGIFNPQTAVGIRSRAFGRHPGISASEVDRYLGDLQENFGRLLKQAEGFHRALEAADIPPAVRVVLLGGDCKPTRRGFVAEEENLHMVLRLNPDQVQRPTRGVELGPLFYEDGDGAVTRSSLLGSLPAPPGTGTKGRSLYPGSTCIFACARHARLGANPTIQEALLDSLLSGPAASDAAPRSETGR